MKKNFLFISIMLMSLCSCEVRSNVSEPKKQTMETIEPTKESDNTVLQSERPPLSVPNLGDCFEYNGKKIPIGTNEAGAYITEVKYISEKEIAVYCHLSLDAEIFMIYDIEKGKYTAEKKGIDFMWQDEDSSTLCYVSLSPEREYILCNYDDKELYSSNNPFKMTTFIKGGKVEIEETESDGTGEGACFKKEISIKV